ncbi:non-ribosomal peptide synthase/polyketide synthase [Roseivirga sp. BDSF3-8]|uniref:non-ribosomal peptide synthase/polyketide synthase n=1 Tax=Roseivirga sp. BDSF3-8 TaxID=3241598 RepID=UPI00353204B9
MIIEELLNELIASQVKLSVKEDKLLCKLPEQGIDKNLLAQLREHKEEVKQLLLSRRNGGTKKRLSISKRDANGPGKLSYTQRRLWMLDQIEGSTHYNISNTLLLEGELNVDLFRETFNTILVRHEVLRSTYHVDEQSEAYQVVHPAEPLKIELEDYRHFTERERKEILSTAQLEESTKAFDLQSDSMLRVRLLQTEDNTFTVIVTVHHIATDGWSIGLIVREFCVLYTALCEGKSSPLPKLSIQYIDYAAWQQNWLKGNNLERLRNYWHRQLHLLPSVHSLPLDHKRPAEQTFNGHTIRTKINSGVVQQLKKLCDREATTLFTGLYSVFSVLLARCSNENDIVVGTPIANREQAEVADLIGFFVNMLVLRSTMTGQMSFTQLVNLNKQMLLEAYAHQQMPFDMLVSELQKERNTSYSSLFQVMFSFQNFDKTHAELPGVSLSLVDQEKPYALYDLSLVVEELEEGLLLKWEYNSDLFTTGSIERMAEYYTNLLQSLSRSPHQPLGQANMLSESQTEQLLTYAEGKIAPYPEDKTLIDLYSEQVNSTPDATAIIYENRELSYRQVDEQVSKLAHFLLSEYKVVPEDLIGVKLERSEWLPISLLAVMKAGAAYVPIDPAYPESRIAFMEEDSRCRLTIDEELLKKFSSSTVAGIAPGVTIDRSNLAYVLYTSGSTGQPKGVMIEHRNVAALLHWAREEFYNTGVETVYAVTSHCFDLSVFEFFYPLITGKKVKVLNNGLSIPAHLPNDSGVLINTVPSVLNNLLQTSLSLDNVVAINLAGEAFPLSIAGQLKDTGIEIRNLYGPSEDTTYSTGYLLASDYNTSVPIGRPIHNTQAYILSDALMLQPLGVSGQICLSGNGLARGYLRRPQLTGARFIDHPFKEGEKLYQTGDLGRWLPGGILEYQGRFDDQVKVRGHRIELGEVEHIIFGIAGVDKVVVTVREEVLVAYIVPFGQLDKAALKTEISTKLPGYMVPAYFVEIEAVPLTANGKVDKKALPAFSNEDKVQREYIAPGTVTEKALAELWSDVLGVEQVGVTDNFFELGGHSLKVTLLVNRIRKELNQELEAKEIFSSPTIRRIADKLTEKRYSAIPHVSDQESYVVTSSQRRLYGLSQLAEVNIAYNIPGAFEVNSPLDKGLLLETFISLIERHESLRTIFRKDRSGEVRQHILTAGEVSLHILEDDLRYDLDPENTLTSLLKGYYSHRFDLGKAPLFRAGVIRVSDKRSVLWFNMHHIISDGWSMEVLIREFTSVYDSLSQGKNPELPELPIQYKDYAEWMISEEKQQELEASEAYWLDRFSGSLPVLEMPTDYPRPKVKTYNGSSHYRRFSKELTGSLHSFAKDQKVSLFMLLMSGLNGLFSRYTNTGDVVIGTPLAGRQHPDLEGQIGLYLNTLAIRTQFDPESSFSSLLEAQKESLTGAYAHQDYPFDRLVEQLGLKSDTSRSALFSVTMTLQNQQELFDASDLSASSLQLSYYKDNHSRSTQFDMSFLFTEQDERLNLQIQYNTDLYSEDFIAQIARHLEQFLGTAVSNAEQSVSTISYLEASEKDHLLDDFNYTTSDYPSDKTIVDLFAQQVKSTPDAVAVVFEERELSYRELDEVSSRLAHYLLNYYQPETEDFIGLKIQRSEWVLICELAILKAGCAYVPIDPAYPARRIAYIETDSKCRTTIDEEILEHFRVEISNFPTHYPDVATSSRSLAYMMYTSGSTGEPKGVMVEHRSVVRLVKNSNYYSFTPADILLTTGAMSFDATTFEYWGPLLNGSKLVVCPQAILLNNTSFAKEISRNEVNVMWITSGWFNHIADEMPELFNPLKTILVGGDKLSPAHIRKVKNLNAGVEVINGYGPTENTTFSLTYLIPSVEGDIPIGTPISNSTAYILDDRMQVQPIGVVGEICLGGDGLARGYWQAASLTAEKFIDHPYRKGEKLYKTGDLGRWLPDGMIEFSGRKDDQVKIRGFRIELGEIESALTMQPEVDQSVVVVQREESGPVLAAYMVAREQLNKAQLRNRLNDLLPDYMLPAYYVQVDSLPLTVNGKVDKKALPAYSNHDLVQGEYLAPESKLEEQLVLIWKEVLDIDEIGVTDNFFDLGGHSLKAILLVNRILQELGQDVDIGDMFDNPTIRGIAEKLTKGDYSAIPLAPEKDSYASTSSQRRLYVLSQLAESSVAYSIPGAFEIEGEPDIDLLYTTFEVLIDRHASLRTIFKENAQGRVRQYILSVEDISFRPSEDDIRDHTESESALRDLLEKYYNQRIELDKAPLFRTGVIRVSEERSVLWFNMHHIISDGWSMEVLVREFTSVYDSLSRNRTPELPSLPVQYKDYAEWMESEEKQAELEASRAYWLEKFSGSLPVLEMPTDYPRPKIKTYNGSSHYRRFGKELTGLLHGFAREQEVSLFMLLMSGLNGLFSRYAHTGDVVMGTPLAGRQHPDLEGQIGLYLNTLAIRTQFDREGSFSSLLEAQKQTLTEAYAHQDYPFDRLVEELDLAVDTSRSALFDVMVVLQNQQELFGGSDLSTPSLKLRHYEEDHRRSSQFDMSFLFTEHDGRLTLHIEYNTDLYGSGFIEQFARHLEQFLQEAISNPSQPVSAIAYLEASEKQTLLEGFNNTASGYPSDKTIVDLFAEQANATPDTTALVCEDRKLSYRELEEVSNRLAHYLLAHYGIHNGDFVGVKVERSEWSVISFLSILKAGGAYVPIDVNYPAQRIAYIEEDTRCQVTIDEDVLTTFRNSEGLSDSRPDITTGPDRLAYVMYTSGSTGNPKGIQIEHRSVVRLAKNTNYIDFRAGQRILGLSSFSFDGSTFDIYMSLLNGGTLVIASRDVFLELDKLGSLIADQQIDSFFITTALFNKLSEAELPQAGRLKYILFGGEQVSVQHVKRFKAQHPEVHLHHVYGPTENTTFSTYYPIEAVAEKAATIPIGGGIANSTCYILDEHHHLVPVGVVGEICLGGDGLARGYWQAASLTAEKFIDHPYRKGEKLYKTGDLGRWLPEGVIEFAGRKDDQVKIRGFRIELGEIESALTMQPEVDQSVVVVQREESGPVLAAYLVAGGELNRSSLRRRLGEQLPAYMLPAYYVQVEALPLNANGKVDKRALPPYSSEDMVQREYVSPSTDTERILTELWSEILGVEQVGVTDNFFELGGHSLKVTLLINRIRRQLSREVEIRDVFSDPTIRGIAEKLTEGVYSAIPLAPEKDSYASTSSQRRLYVLSQFAEGSVAYNIPGGFEVEGSLDTGILHKTFEVIIDRHASLRTIFKENAQGRVRQYILSVEDISFRPSEDDIRDHTESESALRDLLEKYYNQRIELDKAPLFRTGVIRFSQERSVLWFNMHHIISDGWSMEVLVREFTSVYDSLSRNRTPELPSLPVQYKDYAEWMESEEKQAELEASRAYWLEKFSGSLPVLEMPTDYPRPKIKTYNGSSHYRRFGKELTGLLHGFAREQEVSLFMLLMSGLNGLFSRYAHTGDVVMGTPLAGRQHPDLEGQIGLYLNTLAIRTQFDREGSFSSLLEAQKQTLTEAYAHQDYPFDRLVEELDLAVDTSRSALFDVMVVLQNQQELFGGSDLSTPSLKLRHYEEDHRRSSQFDMSFLFTEHDGRLTLHIEYNTDLYGSGFIEQFARHLEQFLQEAISNPSQPVSAIAYLEASEKQTLLEGFNNTASGYPSDKTIVDLFAEQANATPDTTALVCEDRKLSYRELEEVSNRLAHYLLAHYGIHNGDFVGVKVERSEWSVISFLSILKAGGAYVPIDVNYPAQRIAYIEEDTRCQVTIDEDVLTTFRNSEGLSDSRPDITTGPDRLAYVMYTSGSTGNPKGIQIEHRSVVRLAKNTNYIDFRAGQRILGLSSFSFDGSTFDIYMSLLNGGTLVIASRDVFLELDKLGSLIADQQIDSFFITTALFNKLSEAELPQAGRLKYILFGGEQVSVQHVKRFKAQHPEVHLHHVYGPTENTTFSTYYPIEAVAEKAATIPIGGGIANSTCYILDEHHHLVPVGVVGEICLGGDGLARGYWQAASLTAEKFIDHPYRKGEKLYKTGDLGRWLPEGVIEFAGRKDDQVKIRGFRIELGEIESALTMQPEVDQSVVVVQREESGPVLAAYLVAGGELNRSSLRRRLGEQLPAYMLPAYYVQVEALPLNANGKVDKRALPPYSSEDMVQREYVSPSTDTERILTELWSEILGVEQVGVTDNFFELGGHSLKVTLLINRIRRQLSREVEIRDVFSDPTIRGIAEKLTEGVYSAIPLAPEKDSYASTSSQRRLYVLSQLAESSVAYSIPGAFEIEGEPDIDLLYTTFEVLIDRHASLRTIFKENAQGRVRQYILSVEDISFRPSEDDIRDHTESESALRDLLEKYYNQRIELDKAPLFRTGVIRFSQERSVLWFNMHHIISDGWSMEVLVREFTSVYDSLSRNRTPELPSLPVQYKDYAEWMESEEKQAELEASRAYWLEKFSGSLPVLEMPTDYPRPKIKTYNGSSHYRRFGKELTGLLHGFAREQEVSLFMLLMSGLNGLFSRYAHTGDVVMGTPLAGRQHPDLEGQIGLYLNTLAIRTQFDREGSFSSLLEAQKQTLTEAYAHQDYPFDRLVEELDLAVDTSRSALFDVMVVLQNQQELFGGSDLSTPSLKLRHYEEDHRRSSQFDMSFLFTEHDGRLTLHIEYNTDLYGSGFIEQFARHLEQFLQEAISNPSQPVSAIAYLEASEKQTLLEGFNNTASGYPSDKTIVDLFAEQANATPDTTALVCEDRKLSYRELEEVSNRLAHYLLAHYGIHNGDFVGVKVERSEWSVISFLSILKAGGAYVPIDVNYPAQRIAYIEEDTRCQVTIDEDVLTTFRNSEGLSDSRPDITTGPDRLAYVMYTSGSTGNPKGIQIEHRSVVRLAKNTNYIDFRAGQRILGLSSFSFDGSTFDIYMSLLNGGTLVIASRDVFLELDKLGSLIADQQIDSFFITTALFNKLSEAELPQAGRLKYILFGGEQVSVQHVKRFKAQHPEVHLHHVYGPTENTTFSTYYPIEAVAEKAATIPIGGGIANSTCYILDEHHHLVPVGVVGEICLGGDGLARGYWQAASLTAEKFIDHPYRKGEKLYKTGDLGRWLPEGVIEFAGRKDDQVKIRGFRIELGEIESALTMQPEVDQSVVVVQREESGPVLAAYLVAGGELNRSSLRRRLGEQLPAYMLPAYYVQVEALPLNANGKVDKRALPPYSSEDMVQREYVSPSTDTERILTELWSEILGVEQVGVTDNFFELGGHSLKVTLLINRIRRQLSREVEIRDVFSDPTIRGIAEKLTEGVYSAIPLAPEKDSYASTSSQRRLYVLSQFAEGSVAYNIPGGFEVEGSLDTGILHKTFEVIIDRHASLRTIFKENAQGRVRQYILSVEDISFRPSEDDIRDHTESESALRDLLEKYYNQRIELDKAPLFRTGVIRFSQERSVLWFNMHHIISDGWSMEVLVREFTSVYDSLSRNRTPELPSLPVQYKDYAEWMESEEKQAELEASRAYWLEKFSGSLPVLEMPTDYPRPKIKTYNGSSHYRRFGKELTGLLHGFAREQEVSLFMLLMSGLNGLFSRYAHTGDVVMGTPLAGRQHPDLEGQIGLYLNTLAIRTQFDREGSFSSLLEAQKQTLTEAYAHQDYPFDRLVEELDLAVDTSRSALFDVMVVLQNQQELFGGSDLSTPSLKLRHYEEDHRRSSQFDMSFLFTEHDGRLTLHIEYNTDLYGSGFIEQFARHLEQFLQEAISNPSQPVSAIAYLEASEKQTLLEGFNNTASGYPSDKTIVDLFAEQANATPEATAVVCEDRELSYRELEEASNRLAHYLLATFGLEAEDFVGVKLERSEWFLISELAILKAGCAYVPVDPTYPAQRIEFIEKDSNCQVTIDEEMLARFKSVMSTYPSDSPEVPCNAGSLAYMMYTSGSTGEPKGVMIEHRSVVRLVKNTNYYTFSSSDVLLATGALSFDATTFEYWGALLNGGRLIICPQSTLLTNALFAEQVRLQQVNVMWLTSGWFNHVVDEVPELFAPLKTILVGGDKLSPVHISKVKELYPDLEVINGYGPTENTTFSLTYRIPQVDGDIPVGTPISNSTAYILDDHLQVQPVGVVGEICLGGDGLARGYWQAVSLTAEKFIDHPYRKGEKLYRTGDLGRWLPNGVIEFAGRKDDQVKIRGFRIELGEIEMAIFSYSDIIQQVCVNLIKHQDENVLATYLVAKEAIDKRKLLNYLRAVLPHYMIPSHYVEMDALPLSNNGKVDKKRLPDISESDLIRKEYIAPRTSTEEYLVDIWENVLNVDKVGITDNFFELGGHSLAAVKISSAIQEKFNVKIDLSIMFTKADIANLAEEIDNAYWQNEEIEEDKVTDRITI